MKNYQGRLLKKQYFLRRLAAEGGMAYVYQAFDRKRYTKMAIKILRRDLAGSDRIFSREANVLVEMDHPNIVRIYEFAREGDISFIVLDWIEGQNLRELIKARNSPLSLDEISKILEPICIALHYAHQKKIYHCDVKSSNILIDKDGKVFLTDFGIAQVTRGQQTSGTPPYMSPEQLTGKVIDQRTDIYALGITLYEMLSGGNLPFRGDSKHPGSTTRQRITWEHINLPIPPLHQHNPGVPNSVDSVVKTALNKDPKLRFSTTLEMWQAFDLASKSGQKNREDFQKTVILPLEPPLTPIPPKRDSQPAQPPVEPPRKLPKKLGVPYLFARSGEKQGEQIPITKHGISIGRNRENSLILLERSVSRHHAKIITARKGIYIQDERSSLGTFVNGQKISGDYPLLLTDGDVIQIGLYQVFEFHQK